jgi:hypothetical protein
MQAPPTRGFYKVEIIAVSQRFRRDKLPVANAGPIAHEHLTEGSKHEAGEGAPREPLQGMQAHEMLAQFSHILVLK